MDLPPVHDRQADPAAHPLEQRLVHPDRRGRDAGTRVGQAGRLEERPGPSRPRRTGRAGRSRPPAPVAWRRAGRWRPRPGAVRSRRGRAGRRSRPPGDRPGVTGREPPPAPIEVDQDRLDREASAARAAAIAVPDTTDTSCSADGPPSRTTTGGRALMPPPPSRSSRPRTRPRTRGSRRAGRGPRPGRARPGAGRRRPPLLVVDDEVGVLLRDDGPPIRVPLSPAASISRPAESPSGLRKTLPADGRPSGWCAWRQWRMSSSRALIVSGSAGARRNVASTMTSRGPSPPCLNRLSRYESASSLAGTIVSVPSAARTRAVSRTPATSASWAPALAQTAPPTVPRDGQPELEPGQARALRLGRGARHLDAGLGRVPIAVGARALGADLDHEAADPGVGDDEVAPAAEDEMGQLARPREPHERPQLVGVVHGREEVGRPADAHRGEPGERFVARGLDPDPALDVGPGRDRIEGGDHRASPRAMRSISDGSGNGSRAPPPRGRWRPRRRPRPVGPGRARRRTWPHARPDRRAAGRRRATRRHRSRRRR